jgi:plasmid stabilization system protein ParE
MPEYRLSEAAAEDLIQIALYGFENFGLERSEKYRDKLKKTVCRHCVQSAAFCQRRLHQNGLSPERVRLTLNLLSHREEGRFNFAYFRTAGY